ncbi:Ras-related protein Rab-24 [Pitangus sulphuratus]|nr:Ras-related protein Rab-24 [Pitangus sulphuratus]
MSGRRVDAKVVLLGQEGVGKSSLVERCAHGRFRAGPYQNTIGAAFVAKVMSVGEQTVTLGIWDTAGSERYEAMSRIYYRGARAAVVCYDLTDSGSFQRAKFWVNELQNCEEGCRIYLCGTKCDLLEEDRRKRGVDFHDVQDYADEIKADHFETSSKTGQSVDELFQKVAEDYVNFSAFQVMTDMESQLYGDGIQLARKPSPGAGSQSGKDMHLTAHHLILKLLHSQGSLTDRLPLNVVTKERPLAVPGNPPTNQTWSLNMLDQ